MFGFSFGELVVLVVVAVVVIGPKDLPKVLRTLGQWAGKLRRMASELRAQSGIDDVLRTEGLTEDLNEIRKLARGELDTVSRATLGGISGGASLGGFGSDNGPALSSYEDSLIAVDRDREHPRDGADTGNALPDTAFVYVESFPRSKWADDPVWVLGDPDGIIPPKAEASPAPSDAAHSDAAPSDVAPSDAPVPPPVPGASADASDSPKDSPTSADPA